MLRSLSLPTNLVKLFESMYRQTQCSVRCGRTIGERFRTGMGVQQGCYSGSWAFNIYLHFAFQPILAELEALGVRMLYRSKDGREMDARDFKDSNARGEFRIGSMFFIDDTLLLCDTIDGLRRAIELVERQLGLFGLRANPSKSDAVAFAAQRAQPCMLCGGLDARDADVVICDACGRVACVSCLELEEPPEDDWWCPGCGGPEACAGEVHSCAQESVTRPVLPFGDSHIEWADEVKYLGVKFAADCGLGPELRSRIRAAQAAFRRLRPLFGGGLARQRSKFARRTFCRAMKSLVVSSLLYGCEAWALSEAERQRLNVAHRGMLRQAAGVPRRGMGSSELYELFDAEPADAMVTRRQLQWLGHVGRMEKTRTARRDAGCSAPGGRCGTSRGEATPGRRCSGAGERRACTWSLCRRQREGGRCSRATLAKNISINQNHQEGTVNGLN